MISSAERNRLLAVVLIALCFLGCGVDQTEPLPAPVSAAATTTLRLEMVSGAAHPGDTVCVALRLSDTSAGDPIAGLQGTIRFDPRRLRYAGQVAEPPTLAMVGDDHAADGMLRVLAVSPRGLPSRVAVLAFEVVSSGYEAGLSYESTRVVSRGLIDEAVAVTPGVVPPSGALPASPSIRRLGVAEWGDLLAPGLPNEARVPGQIVPGLRYGDITLNGTINVLDVVAASDVAVGMADLIINPSVDVVVAGNVAPFNLPGLGEPDDLYPPGRETDGSYRIDVMDVVAISDEAVGLNPPVVGDLIPGRFAPLGTDRRVIVSGNIASDRTFYRDSIYELQGMVNVPGSVTLTIQAGTQIEGDVATRGALSIRRGGRIQATGTRLQPIIFTCNASNKTPGCWGGINLNGFSLLNNGEGTSDPTAPAGVQATGGVGCPEKEAPDAGGTYGGCLIEDGSGTIRYVRIEYAGMAGSDGKQVSALALLGAGSGTVVDSIQVHGSLAEGIFVSGGTVDLRNVMLTANGGAALRWDDGWVGRVQFLAVQQWIGGPALRGSNSAVDPNAGPRSAPQIYQATLIGPPTSGAGGIFLENGSALILRDAIVGEAGVGLDIDGAETCAQVGGMPGIDVSSSIFFGGTPDFSDDADCVDESSYALDPSRLNRVSDPGLIAPFNTLTPDLRPAPGSSASAGFVSPPSNGFFDLAQPFIGAVAPAILSGSNIPWYAGWSRGWNGTP